MSDQPETRIREAMADVHDCRTEAQRAAGEPRRIGVTPPLKLGYVDLELELEWVAWHCFRCGAEGGVNLGPLHEA